MAGRKSLKDELRLFERYSELSVPYFRVLKKNLASGKKDDQRWAVEQLTKAFTKMLPQKLEGSGENGEFVVTWKSSQSPTSLEAGLNSSITQVNDG